MLNELRSVSDTHFLRESIVTKHAKNLHALVDQFDSPTPTSCCYQFVPTTEGKSENFEIHYYFALPNIGITHCVFDHWTNIFLGGILLHGTSVPIFYERNDDEELVFIGEHPTANLVA